jgi:hypothetical protein
VKRGNEPKENRIRTSAFAATACAVLLALQYPRSATHGCPARITKFLSASPISAPPTRIATARRSTSRSAKWMRAVVPSAPGFGAVVASTAMTS